MLTEGFEEDNISHLNGIHYYFHLLLVVRRQRKRRKREEQQLNQKYNTSGINTYLCYYAVDVEDDYHNKIQKAEN